MATLVTGGTGFVASNIVKALAQRGHEVVCFDLTPPDDLVRKHMEPLGKQVTFIQGDILNKSDLDKMVSQHTITKVVHAAVYTAIRPDIEVGRSRSIVDINVAGTANLLDMAIGLSLDRFLYVSSGSVYGEGRSPSGVLKEDTHLYPRTLYAATKYASELLTRRYGELHGFPTVSVRLSSPYGPMERTTGHRAVMSVLQEWTGNVARGEPVRVGDRTAGRDYTYVADIAAGICAILDAPKLSFEEYNNSNGRWMSLGDIVEALQQLRPGIQVVDDPNVEVGIAQSAASRAVLDVTRLREDVGFTASFDLASGLKDYLQWREANSFYD